MMSKGSKRRTKSLRTDLPQKALLDLPDKVIEKTLGKRQADAK